jgi:hypothetical protein
MPHSRRAVWRVPLPSVFVPNLICGGDYAGQAAGFNISLPSVLRPQSSVLLVLKSGRNRVEFIRLLPQTPANCRDIAIIRMQVQYYQVLKRQ